MKLTSLIKEIKLNERFLEICSHCQNENYGNPRPKKEDVLGVLSKTGFTAKYIHRDRIYLISTVIGKYNLDYHVGLDGASCAIYIYIKSGDYWPVKNILGDLYEASHDRSDSATKYKEKTLFCSSIMEFEVIMLKIKPLLIDFETSITPYLQSDNLEFDISN